MKKNYFAWLAVVLIIVSFGLSTLVSVISLNKVLSSNEEGYAKILAGNVYDTINNEMSKPITVGQTMAHDTFLISMLVDEERYPEASVENVLKEYLGTMTKRMHYNTAFVISAKTGRYYTQQGFNKVVDPVNDKHDIWYSLFLDKNEQYDFDIDMDEANSNSWTVFVNNRIEDENGELLGVCGVGVIMTDMQNTLQELQEEYDMQINLVDKNGLVQVDVDDINIENAVYSIAADKYNNGYNYEAADGGYTIVRYMDNLGFYLLIRKEGIDRNAAFSSMITRNLITMGIIVALLLFGVLYVMYKDNEKVEKAAKVQGLASLSEIYTSMHLLDLQRDTVETIIHNEHVDEYLDEKKGFIAQQMQNVVTHVCTETYLADMLAFTDLSTLAARLDGGRTISHEFVSPNTGWCRARFLVEKEDDGQPSSVLFAVEIIEKEKQHERELVALAETDKLTGIRNRASGEKLISDCLLGKMSGMMLLLDGDDFKSYNDTFGHDVGDKVLIAIAESMTKAFAANDVVFRLGGDEFAAYVLGVTNEQEGISRIENFFSHINQIEIPEIGEKKVTVSVGASIYDGEGRVSFPEIYKQVDVMLYESKKLKGNVYTFYKED